MDEALIQNAQDDIDHDHRHQQQPAHIGGRALERRGRAGKAARTRWWAVRRSCRWHSLTPVTASLKALPGARSKEMVMAGIWPEWLIAGGMVRRLICVTAVNGTMPPPCTAQIEPGQAGGIELVLRQKLQDHLILIGRGIDLRHLLAAKGEPQRALDIVRRDAQRGGPCPVDRHLHGGRHLVLVAVDADEGRVVLHRLGQLLGGLLQLRQDPGPAACIDRWSARTRPPMRMMGGLLKVMAVPGMLRSLARSSFATWSADSSRCDKRFQRDVHVATLVALDVGDIGIGLDHLHHPAGIGHHLVEGRCRSGSGHCRATGRCRRWAGSPAA